MRVIWWLGFLGLINSVSVVRGSDFSKSPDHDKCSSEGQFLLHPTNRCKFIHCTHSVVPRGGKKKFMEVTQDCPLGTAVPMSFYSSKALNNGVAQDHTLCTDEPVISEPNYCLVDKDRDEEMVQEDNDYFLLPVDAYVQRKSGKRSRESAQKNREPLTTAERFSISQNTPHEWYNVLVEKNLQKSIVDGKFHMSAENRNEGRKSSKRTDNNVKQYSNWHKDPTEKYKVYESDYHELNVPKELLEEEKPSPFPDPPPTFHRLPFDLNKMKYDFLEPRSHVAPNRKPPTHKTKPAAKRQYQRIELSNNNNNPPPSWSTFGKTPMPSAGESQNYQMFKNGGQRTYSSGFIEGTRTASSQPGMWSSNIDRISRGSPVQGPNPQSFAESVGLRNKNYHPINSNFQLPYTPSHSYQSQVDPHTEGHPYGYGLKGFRNMPDVTNNRAFTSEYKGNGAPKRNQGKYDTLIHRPNGKSVRSPTDRNYIKRNANTDYPFEKGSYSMAKPAYTRTENSFENSIADRTNGHFDRGSALRSNGFVDRNRDIAGQYSSPPYERQQYSNTDQGRPKGDIGSSITSYSDRNSQYQEKQGGLRQEQSGRSDTFFSGEFNKQYSKNKEPSIKAPYRGSSREYGYENNRMPHTGPYDREKPKNRLDESQYDTNYKDTGHGQYEGKTMDPKGFGGRTLPRSEPNLGTPYQGAHGPDYRNIKGDFQPLGAMGGYESKNLLDRNSERGQFGNSHTFNSHRYANKNQEVQTHVPRSPRRDHAEGFPSSASRDQKQGHLDTGFSNLYRGDRGSAVRVGHPGGQNRAESGRVHKQNQYQGRATGKFYEPQHGKNSVHQPGYYDFMHKEFQGGYRGDNSMKQGSSNAGGLGLNPQTPTKYDGKVERAKNQMRHGYSNPRAASNGQRSGGRLNQQGFESQEFERHHIESQGERLPDIDLEPYIIKEENYTPATDGNRDDSNRAIRPVPMDAYDLSPKSPLEKLPAIDLRAQDQVGLKPVKDGQDLKTPGRMNAVPEGKHTRTNPYRPQHRTRYSGTKNPVFSSNKDVNNEMNVNPKSWHGSSKGQGGNDDSDLAGRFSKNEPNNGDDFSTLPPRSKYRYDSHTNRRSNAESGRFDSQKPYRAKKNRMRNREELNRQNSRANIGLTHSEVPRSKTYSQSKIPHQERPHIGRPSHQRTKSDIETNIHTENKDVITLNPLPGPTGNNFDPTSSAINQYLTSNEVGWNVEDPLPEVPTANAPPIELTEKRGNIGRTDPGESPENYTVPTEDVPPTVAHFTSNQGQDFNSGVTTEESPMYRMMRRKMKPNQAPSPGTTPLPVWNEPNRDFSRDEIADTEQVEPSFHFSKTPITGNSENKRKSSEHSVKASTFSDAYKELRYPSWKAVSV